MKRILALTLFCSLASAHADLSNGLVAWYPLNGNSLDASGNGRSLTNAGAVLTTNRFNQPNSAYSFNGVSSIMAETNGADSFILGTGCTLSCWVNLQNTNLNYSVIRHDGDVSLVIVNQYGHLANSFYVEALNRNGKGYTGYAKAPPVRQWCMLTATWDGTNFGQYINGQKQVTLQASSVGTNLTAKLELGNSTIYGQPLFGLLDNVRIYNRPLTSSEVQQLYEADTAPLVNLIKAVIPEFQFLSTGTNYQLQVSRDMNNWTNQGSPFVATNTSMVYPQYWDVDNWSELFFRLITAP